MPDWKPAFDIIAMDRASIFVISDTDKAANTGVSMHYMAAMVINIAAHRYARGEVDAMKPLLLRDLRPGAPHLSVRDNLWAQLERPETHNLSMPRTPEAIDAAFSGSLDRLTLFSYP